MFSGAIIGTVERVSTATIGDFIEFRPEGEKRETVEGKVE